MKKTIQKRQIWHNPALSCSLAKFLAKEIISTPAPRVIIEYGSGGSTLFYLDTVLKQKIPATIISIEFDYSWYKDLIRQIKKDYEYLFNENISFKKWSEDKRNLYMEGENRTLMNIPQEMKLLNIAREKVRKELSLCCSEDDLFFDADYSVSIEPNAVEFQYCLRRDFFKDQFGESPVKTDYVETGISHARKFLKRYPRCSVIFILDGGPRMDSLESASCLLTEFTDASFLFFIHDAYRLYYQDVLKEYPQGYFFRGSDNKTLSGTSVFNLVKESQMDNLERLLYRFEYGTTSPSIEFLLEKEGWIYENAIRLKRKRL